MHRVLEERPHLCELVAHRCGMECVCEDMPHHFHQSCRHLTLRSSPLPATIAAVGVVSVLQRGRAP